MLWTPLLFGWLAPRRALFENRSLTAFPSLPTNLPGVLRYPGKFANWLSDTFPFRGGLIQLHTQLSGSLLRTSPNADVVIGKEGWLFYAGEYALAGWSGLHPFDQQELYAWRDALVARQKALAAQGIRYLVYIAPDKQRIYPEYLPDGYRPGTPTRLEQLQAVLPTDFPLLDGGPDLLAAKSMRRLYLRTDSHWNEMGAFVGYETVITAMQKWFGQIHPISMGIFREAMTTVPSGDLSVMINRLEQIQEPSWFNDKSIRFKRPKVIDPKVPVDIVNDRADLETALIFHDSFGVGLMPFIAHHFRHAVFIHHKDVDMARVQAMRPQVVIHEIIERRLNRPLEKELAEPVK